MLRSGSFIVTYLYAFTPVFALLAFLASLTIFKQRQAAPRSLRVFSIWLLVNLVMESVSAYQAYHKINNLFFGDLITVLDFTFYGYFVREFIRSGKARKVLLICLIVYPAIFLANILLVQGSTAFHSMTYSLGCVLIIVSCIYYFLELFQRTYSVNLARQPAFWICSGLLFNYTCTFPVYGATNMLNVLPLVIKRNLLFILVLLNILSYLSFTIAFLCRLKSRRSVNRLSSSAAD